MKTLLEQYKEEISCHDHCIKLAARHTKQRNWKEAAIYLEDAAKSLKEMDRLREEKQDLEDGKITITVQQLRGKKS